MLLIVTNPEDAHANAAEAELDRRGARYLRFDPQGVSSRAALRIEHAPDGSRYWLSENGRSHALHEVTAGWLRRPVCPEPPPLRNAWMSEYASLECERLVHDLWNHLPIRWLPGPLASIRRADHKQLQLALARSVGLTIPATLFTNDPDALLEFYRAHDGRIIDKMPSTVLAQRHSNDFIRFTQVVSPRDLVYLERLRTSPMLFQAYVPKHSELRVTIVGDRVLTCEIGSQDSAHTRDDWRRYDLSHTRHSIHQLPATIEAACIAMVRKLGLVYGALDFVLTPEGEYVFLEINPNGQFLWIEHMTGLPILRTIVDFLLAEDNANA